MLPLRPSVGVIGAGVAGIVAAYVLQQRYEVTLFERNDYLGGHTRTITLTDGPDAGTAVDTGFIVFNRETYPNFVRFLSRLGVASRESDMSFSYWDQRTNFQWAGTDWNGLFAQRGNLLRPRFWTMLADILRFNREALADLEAGNLPANLSLGEYLAGKQLSAAFAEHYLVPMGAAIWSTPFAEMLRFPAAHFVRFFRNHGLLTVKDQLQWYTVTGGSHTYVKQFQKVFTGRVCLGSRIRRVRRTGDEALVEMEDGATHSFDYLVLAAHADESLALLSDPSGEEIRLLSPWFYSRNQTVLHTDERALPPLKRARASWNYVREGGLPTSPVSVTYLMNRLQGLKTQQTYAVSLNRATPLDPSRILREMVYTHPIYSPAAMGTQSELPNLNGRRRTFFCGSYFGNGFHEDAVRSALQVGEALGVSL